MFTTKYFRHTKGDSDQHSNKREGTPSALVALLPVVFLVALVSVAVSSFGSDSLEGANQMVLLGTSALVVFIGMTFYGTRWKEIEDCLVSNIGGVATAIVILLIIGALSSTWMISGVVPTLIYYGLEILSPKFFLASSCIICAAVSVMTGSSWTTIATIGIALMGIGRAMGFDDGWIAGAIISGAYFGDKISPLSDTTVLAATTCEVSLFTHIRYMLYTTIPSFCIALVVFIVAGLLFPAASEASTEAFQTAISQRFCLSPWLLIVPALTAWLIARKTPAIITLSLATMMAMLACVIAQPEALREIAGEKTLFDGLMMSFYGPTALASGNATLADLISTSGMAGMMNTVWLILCAITFGAVMQATGMLDALTRMFVSLAKGVVSLVSGTVFMGILLNLITSDQYLSIILGGKMFANAYKDRGLPSKLQSRAIEDGTTVTSVLIPWNTCGMTQSTVLGVATIAYLPYTVFCYVSPLMSILAATYINLRKTSKNHTNSIISDNA